jgi:hypothetical protein
MVVSVVCAVVAALFLMFHLNEGTTQGWVAWWAFTFGFNVANAVSAILSHEGSK